MLRDRWLANSGYRVVSVPGYEWATLHGPADKREYVKRRLQLCLEGAQSPACLLSQ